MTEERKDDALRKIANELIGLGQWIEEYLDGDMDTLPDVFAVQEVNQRFRDFVYCDDD